MHNVNYGVDEVQRAIDGLTSLLGCGPAKAFQAEYEAGLHPTLLNYDKIDTSQTSVPAFTKYLVGAGSFLHQPANFYHIFGTCRCVNLIQFLERAVRLLTSTHVEGIHTRLERLISENKRDAFEAIAFELITAARYIEHPAVTSVKFIEETPTRKTPDFVVSTNLFELYVECKKIDRTQDFTLQIRNAARDLINPVLKSFRDNSKSVVADITFNSDPRSLSSHKLQKAFEIALRKQVPIIDQDFTVTAKQPSSYDTGDITLCPSPALWWERYGYRVRSEWIGIVNALDCQWAHRNDLPKNLTGGMSTWINDIAWEGAAKWKISSDELMAKYRRFAFDGVFKGLDQIQGQGKNSTLHLWLESDYYTGGRDNAFIDLFNRIVAKQRHDFGWFVINEMLVDVSPKGRFDFIEHAHIVEGPTAVTHKPLVTNVFISGGTTYRSGKFGTGTELPDIDSEG